MACEIIQINRNSWRIEDSGVRFFLLAGTERALLIDSGRSVRNARDIAESLTDLPVSLLNTHADMDHIGSNSQFESFYMHPDEEPCYRRQEQGGTLIPVVENDVLDLGDRELRIIHLPGHTPGSIAVLDVRARVLISGDPIQEHGRIYMFGSHRSLTDYILSLDHLETYTDEFDEIWPSHADIPVSPDLIPKLRSAARDIVERKASGLQEELHGKQITAYDFGFCTLLCDR